MQFSKKMTGIEPSDIRKYTSIVEHRKSQGLDGINLAQGHCFIEPQASFDALERGVQDAFEKGREDSGFTTYVHASGNQQLLEAIAGKLSGFNQIKNLSPDIVEGNIVVTHGASGAMACTLDAILDEGTEVILFEPVYNYHVKAVQKRGAIPAFVKLEKPNWEFGIEAMEEKFVPGKTRAIIVNTPNNPSGKVFTRIELEAIAEFCCKHDIVAITDEVYEFITFDDAEHISLASIPGMENRTVTISSFSKTLAATGIRIGYAATNNSHLAQRIRVSNEIDFICASSPIQHALIELTNKWELFRNLSKAFAAKRTVLADGLQKAGFSVNIPVGAYYIMADVSEFGFSSDVEAVEALISQAGVGAVPGTAFYSNDSDGKGQQSSGQNEIRFCFAVRMDELRLATKLISDWKPNDG